MTDKKNKVKILNIELQKSKNIIKKKINIQNIIKSRRYIRKNILISRFFRRKILIPKRNIHKIKMNIQKAKPKPRPNIQKSKQNIQKPKQNIQNAKSNIKNTKSNIKNAKSNIQNAKSNIQNAKSNIENVIPKTNIQKLKKITPLKNYTKPNILKSINRTINIKETINTEGTIIDPSIYLDPNIIPGAIIIYSCNKHKETRLKKFILKDKTYKYWKVFIIIGNPLITSDYEINDNVITLKCEDSYIHLTKKVILAFKVIFSLYKVKEGILRCGDDLYFNKNNLEKFLIVPNKKDYIGVIWKHEKKMRKIEDNFMINYFNSHPEELLNKLNGINYTLEEMQKFNQIPLVNYTHGVVVYLSKKSCDILINHMEKINWNVFTEDSKYGYPYIIEDVGIGFILNLNSIYFNLLIALLSIQPSFPSVS